MGGNNIQALVSTINSAGGSNRWAVNASGTAPSYFGGTVQVVGPVGFQAPPQSNTVLRINYDKTAQTGFILVPTVSEAGAANAIGFFSVAVVQVGSITTTASATSYNTTSDARLKHAVTPLTDALTTLAALRPVRGLWNIDDSPFEGFLAHEVQQIVPAAVTGEPDALNEDGTIRPQGIDMSKLVPWLVGAIQELTARLEAVEAHV